VTRRPVVEPSSVAFDEILFNPLADSCQNLVVKLTGTVCNIDCTYCGEKDKDLTFERFMTPEVFKRTLEAIDRRIDVLFHGGEPLLLGTERFRQLLQVASSLRDRINSVGVQTNGTLLNREWVSLFFDEFMDLDIQVAISLDGTRSMNRLRVTYSGKPTFDRVLKGFELLHQAGKSAGLLSVIGRHALGSQREYVSLLSSLPNLRFVKINPLFDMAQGRLSPDSISPSQFTGFLKGVAAEWIGTGAYQRYPVEPLLSFIQVLKGIDSKYCTFNRRKCLNFTTVYPNGELGICDNFSIKEFPVPLETDKRFSHSLRVLAQSPAMEPLAVMREKCERCNIVDLCGGGCLSQRHSFRLASPDLYEDYCVHRKEMFSFVSELLGTVTAA
jgi:uncharacterized protein